MIIQNQLAIIRQAKKTLCNFLVGKVMGASKGQANPEVVRELLIKQLD